jgi:hypothetical protein
MELNFINDEDFGQGVYTQLIKRKYQKLLLKEILILIMIEL